MYRAPTICNLLLLAFSMLAPIASNSQYERKDSLAYDHQALNTGTDSVLFVRDSIPSGDTCSRTLEHAELRAELHLGKDYVFGDAPFSVKVDFTITAYGSHTGSGNKVWEKAGKLSIDEDEPQQVNVQEFTGDHGQVDRFEISIDNYSSNALVEDSVRLSLYFEDRFGVDVSGVSLTEMVIDQPDVSNPMTFEWSPSCDEVPNYQFQLLRLYNEKESGSYGYDEKYVEATVDWDDALTLETEGPDTSITLTLAQGRGYYIWRVRPIGSKYPGGASHPKNRGDWSSNYADGSTVDITDPANDNEVFFYYQFDDDKNWRFARTFTEGLRMKEAMTYATSLKQVVQQQSKLRTEEDVLVEQRVLDHAGRPALRSLPAPVDRDTLGFFGDFMTTGGATYRAEHFDGAFNFEHPEALNGGPLYDYYSDNNSDTLIPNANGFPFTRELYKRDGSGRVRETAMPGEVHMLDTNTTDRTEKTLYSGVSDDELIRIFGDEAPAASSVHKTISMDPNKVTRVTYLSKQGNKLATCLADGLETPLLDTIENPGTFTVSDTLTTYTKFQSGDQYGIEGGKSVAFAKETTLHVDYVLDPRQLQELCSELCARCDHSIELLLHDHKKQRTTVMAEKLPGTYCDSVGGSDTSITMSLDTILPKGSYTVERRVLTNTMDSTQSPPKAWMDKHLDSVAVAAEERVSDSLSTILTLLDSGDMEGVYDHLGIDTDVEDPDSVFFDSTATVDVGCGSVDIPVNPCPQPDCSPVDFEQRIIDRWKDHPDFDSQLSTYFPDDYTQAGTFDQMVTNMLGYEDQYTIEPYDCQQLSDCWDKVVENFKGLHDLASGSTFELNVVHQFLDCAGWRLKGYRSSANYDPEFQFEYFEYDEDNPTCDTAFCGGSCSTVGWNQDSSDNPVNNDWKLLHGCIHNMDTTSPVDGINDNEVGSTCYERCEDRFEGFVHALERAYHDDSVYVEGDERYLVRDTIWGDSEYSPIGDTLPSNFFDTVSMTHYVSRREISCAARSLVERCKEDCHLTVFRDANGNVDSVGTPAEHEAVKKAMTYAYDLDLEGVSGCDSGFGSISTPPLDTLNSPCSCVEDTNVRKLWDKRYGTDARDEALVLERTSDGGYLMGGFVEDGDTLDVLDSARGGKDYWAAKLNAAGYVDWSTVVGGHDKDVLRAVTEIEDGYVLGGHSASDSTGDKAHASIGGSTDYWLVELDQAGNVRWDSTYGGSGEDRLMTLERTDDGGFLLGGSSNSPADGHKSSGNHSGSYDYWALKVDSNGVPQWDRTIGSDEEDSLHAAIPTSDGGYMLGGYTPGGATGDKSTASAGGEDYWAVKLDSLRNIEFDVSFGGSGDDRLLDVEETYDKGYILAGQTRSSEESPFGGWDVWAVKTDSNGTLEWDSAYGGGYTDFGEKWNIPLGKVRVEQALDSGFVISASTKSDSSGNKLEGQYGSDPDASLGFFLVRTDSMGRRSWTRDAGGDFMEAHAGMAYYTTPDSTLESYVLSGFSNSDSSGLKGDDAYNGSRDHWTIEFVEACSHDNICFKWEDPTIPVDSNTLVLEFDSCGEVEANGVLESIGQQRSAIVSERVDSFETAYKKECSDPDRIRDTLVTSYGLGYHHYTLYYYDRAGNLVRTVPPEGVDLSSTDRQTHPSHNMVTAYEYNSLGQQKRQETPDGGASEFWYDDKGQLRFSRDAQQNAEDRFSYTKYDELGRAIESGESDVDYASFTDSVNVESFPKAGSERTYTVYTDKSTATYPNGFQQQSYLRNRVSYTYNDDSVFNIYSYDPHGNVKWTVRFIPGLGEKTLRYEYDLISGKVKKVAYQEQEADGYRQRYSYDADERIRSAQSSMAGELWDRDASYEYYRHGPLQRTAIGEDKVQGLDRTYTLHGGLKAINHPELTKHDPGKDHENTDNFSADVFGMALGYYDGAFDRSGSPFNASYSELISSETSGLSEQFNGNISSWTLSTDTPSVGRTGHRYRYDRLYRIKKDDQSDHASTWQHDADYDARYTYDGNGNIQTLNRNGHSGVDTAMDDLSYDYISGTNKLDHINDDPLLDGNYQTDLDDQSTSNYGYDQVGRMIRDDSARIEKITWTVNDKVDSVIKTTGDTLHFTYDANGDRASKDIRYGGSEDRKTVFYVRDPQGNVLSVYERNNYEDPNVWEYYQKEQHLYGSERLGMRKRHLFLKRDTMDPQDCDTCCCCDELTDPADLIDDSDDDPLTVDQQVALDPTGGVIVNMEHMSGKYTRRIGEKEYELKDHLGNVRVVVSDRKNADSSAKMLSFNSYYAFGSLQPDRWGSSGDYPQGFNSMRMDNELKGTGNSYTTKFRQYDPRVGRWLSIDPEAQQFPHQSPYVGFDDNPIYFADPLGNVAGDYYNEEGEYLGSDGKDDDKVYVVGSDDDKKKVKSLDEKGKEFSASEIETAFLMPNRDVREDIVAGSKERNDKDNEREYGGIIAKNKNTGEQDVFWAKKGDKISEKDDKGKFDPYNVDNPNMNYEDNDSWTFHTHPDRTWFSDGELWQIEQGPSSADKRRHSNSVMNAGIVLGMRKNEVHLHDKTNKVTLSFSLFKNIGRQ